MSGQRWSECLGFLLALLAFFYFLGFLALLRLDTLFHAYPVSSGRLDLAEFGIAHGRLPTTPDPLWVARGCRFIGERPKLQQSLGAPDMRRNVSPEGHPVLTG